MTITLKELFKESLNQYQNQTAFQIRQDGSCFRLSYSQVGLLVKKLQAALIHLGIKKGDKIILLADNHPYWPVAYFAIVTMGAVVVPLDAQLKKEEANFLIGDSNAKAAIIGKSFISHLKESKIFTKKIILEDLAQLEDFTDLNVDIKPEDIAAIVYTSGTTGIPKGVVLSHKNIVSNVLAVCPLFDFDSSDNFLSVLPLYHMFETTAGFLAPFSKGCTITYAESLKSYSILRNMKETGVTVMCGVPLLYQLFYDGIMRQVEEQGKEKLFKLLLLAAKFFQYLIGINLGKFIFATVHKKFGGKIRFFVSGGAALDADLANKFNLLGFKILQGYGLTESAPILSCNTLKANKFGSVGKPLPGIEIRIAGTDPVGEILAFGPNIMKGYFKQKEWTSRVVVNGWLHTGDVGYLDEDGYLYITGRLKDVIVTASGVNVYPDELETLLNKIPSIKESCVMGQTIKKGLRKGSEEVVAIIVPDQEYFARDGNNDPRYVHKKIDIDIQYFNRNVADHKRIVRFVLRQEELPKTRLKKLKRQELKSEFE